MSIGGRKYEECLLELQAMRPKKEAKGSTGYWYYPIEAFTGAMDKCFGNEHYNVSYSDPVYRRVSSGQETVTVRCTIRIIDDEKLVVKQVDGFGDREIQYSKTGGRADLNNLTSSAAAGAFKDACKYFGIFGYRTEAADVKEKPVRPDQRLSEKERKPETAVNFLVTGAFFKNGEANGKPVWKMPVSSKADGSKGEVVFYHNQVVNKAEKYNRLFACVEDGIKNGKKITCKLRVTKAGERNGLDQYVFKDFAS